MEDKLTFIGPHTCWQKLTYLQLAQPSRRKLQQLTPWRAPAPGPAPPELWSASCHATTWDTLTCPCPLATKSAASAVLSVRMRPALCLRRPPGHARPPAPMHPLALHLIHGLDAGAPPQPATTTAPPPRPDDTAASLMPWGPLSLSLSRRKDLFLFLGLSRVTTAPMTRHRKTPAVPAWDSGYSPVDEHVVCHALRVVISVLL
jgi:hypothetical protein